MEVKVFESKNLGFVVARVDSSENGVWSVRNPRYIQMYQVPSQTNPEVTELAIQLQPIIFMEVLSDDQIKDGGYKTQFPFDEYNDVTHQVSEKIREMYIATEESTVARSQGVVTPPQPTKEDKSSILGADGDSVDGDDEDKVVEIFKN